MREPFQSQVMRAFAPLLERGFAFQRAESGGLGLLVELASDWMEVRIVRDRGSNLLSLRFPGGAWWPAEHVYEAAGSGPTPRERDPLEERAGHLVASLRSLRQFFAKGTEAERARAVEDQRKLYMRRRFGTSAEGSG